MNIEIRPVAAEDSRDELRELVREYLAHEVGQLRAASGMDLDLDTMLSNTFDHIGDYLPPAGSTHLAIDGAGRMLGCVFLKMIRRDACEVKRLYVRPAARGTGLGRRLMEAVLANARSLGAASVLLDTGIYDSAAQALYRKLGFREIGYYPEGENDPALQPYLVYMQLDF